MDAKGTSEDMMPAEERGLEDAIAVVSSLLEDKVRRARVCGYQPCKSDAQAFVEWLAAPAPSTAEPLDRETSSR